MTVIVIILICMLCHAFPVIPFCVTHFYQIATNGAVDLYYYFKHKEYNRCHFYGSIHMVTAYRNKVFGSGKTLDMTMVVREVYHKYNGLPVWSDDEQSFVTQYIHIISNVDLTDVPYTPFTNVNQLKMLSKGQKTLLFCI